MTNRLENQHHQVLALLADQEWHALDALQEALPRISGSSLTARLRDLRQPRHGGWTVECRPVPGRGGLHEYRITKPAPAAESPVSLREDRGHELELDQWLLEAF